MGSPYTNTDPYFIRQTSKWHVKVTQSSSAQQNWLKSSTVTKNIFGLRDTNLANMSAVKSASSLVGDVLKSLPLVT